MSNTEEFLKRPSALYAPIPLKQNMVQMQMNRTLLAVIAGVFAGVVHVEGLLLGMLVYCAWQLVGAAIIWGYIKTPEAYFPKGVRDLLTSGLFSGMMTFVLVWTLVYDLVYIF